MQEKTEIQLEELKTIEAGILAFADKVLKENGIPYYLDGGTLLGAVRHQGFIPWDDDIDIIVRREDYRRALEAIDAAGDRYKTLSRYKDPNYIYLFAKIVDTETILVEPEEIPVAGLGVYIDVFPLDYLPDDAQERLTFQKRVWNYRQIVRRAFAWEKGDHSNSFKSKAGCFLSSLYGAKRALDKIERLCVEGSKNKTGFAADVVAARRVDIAAPSEAFDDTVDVAFEGKLFPAPIGNDAYLTALYGDYMQLPPEEQRVSNHVFRAYWKTGSESPDAAE